MNGWMTFHSYNEGFPRFLDILGAPNFVKDALLKSKGNISTKSFGNGTYLWIFERGKNPKIVRHGTARWHGTIRHSINTAFIH